MSEQVTRQIMGHVPTWLAALFYVSAFCACGWAGLRIWRRVRLHFTGRAAPPEVPCAQRSVASGVFRVIARITRYLVFHQQLLRDPFAGVAHLLTFYGFLILFVGTCLVFLEHDTPLHFFYGWFYLIASCVIDVGGVALVVGLAMFLWRRLPGRTGRILRAAWVAALSWTLLAIAVSGFLLEGARIAADMPGFERWSFVGYAIAMGLRRLGVAGSQAVAVQQVLWTGHAALCILFFALLPWRFFAHMLYSAAAWGTRGRRPAAQLRQVDERVRPGAVIWSDFSWKDLLQADGCTTCGRCNEVCPAAAAGKPLQPREIVLGIRRAMDAAAPPDGADLAAFIDDDALWSCTTCGACNHSCPVDIEVFDKIIDLRRGRVETGDVPAAAESLFESSAERWNPFGKPREDRMAWARGLSISVAADDEPIELLYWVGCAASFDAQAGSVAQAMVRLLNHLNVKYRVLGEREGCTGDPARRLGEEGLYQQLADRNLAVFARHRVGRVLTHCPHCFNALRNEYPQRGPTPEVEHHTQFLARMVAAGRLRPTRREPRRITFHDPCYLGRGNGEMAAPRAALAAATEQTPVEMPRHGVDSFCCGAGGGSMWLDIPGADRVENIRAAEARSTGAALVATGCPFCKTMLESSLQSSIGREPAMSVKDVAEIWVDALVL